jgi:hypothetical protein
MSATHAAYFDIRDDGAGKTRRVRVWTDGYFVYAEPCKDADTDTDDPIWPEPVVAVECFDGQWRAALRGDVAEVDNDGVVVHLCDERWCQPERNNT